MTNTTSNLIEACWKVTPQRPSFTGTEGIVAKLESFEASVAKGQTRREAWSSND